MRSSLNKRFTEHDQKPNSETGVGHFFQPIDDLCSMAGFAVDVRSKVGKKVREHPTAMQDAPVFMCGEMMMVIYRLRMIQTVDASAVALVVVFTFKSEE